MGCARVASHFVSRKPVKIASKSYQNACFWYRQPHSPSLSISLSLHSPHHSPHHTAILSLHSPHHCPPHTTIQPQAITALPAPLPFSHSHTTEAYHCTPLPAPHSHSLSLLLPLTTRTTPSQIWFMENRNCINFVRFRQRPVGGSYNYT